MRTRRGSKCTRTRLAGLLLASLAVFAAAPARGANAPFAKGPYLHDLGTTQVKIRAEVDPPQPIVVELSAAPGANPSGGIARTRVESAEARAFHEVSLTGLEPARKYTYTVRAGKASQAGTFTTPTADDRARFTFLVYGDNRTDPVAHASVVRAMSGAPSDFIVHTGDFVEDGRSAADWQSFFDIENEMLRDRCVFACVGNHELLDGAGLNFVRYFGPTLRDDEPPHLYGTFRWGNSRFFLLNGQDTFTEGPEAAWLRKVLTDAENEPGLVWRFAVVHFGYRSAGPHGDNPRLLAAQIDKLFKDEKVDLVISGHDHLYERGYEKGMRYVVSGGGGAPLYRIRAPLPSTRKVEPTYHFVSFEVSPDRVKLVTTRADGSTLETCGFGKSAPGQAGWDCDGERDMRAAVAGAAAPPPAPAAAPPPAPSQMPCGCAATGRAAGSAPFVALTGLALLALRRRFRYSRA